MSDAVLICRCEEIRESAVAQALLNGAVSVDDVKRRTRAGMGACQGISCIPAVAALVAQATGTPVEELAPMTARPPVRPIPLAALASLAALEDGGNG
ncbi:MAG: (2Fe-2S)-binding protein [Thermomicrobiales bacterium]